VELHSSFPTFASPSVERIERKDLKEGARGKRKEEGKKEGQTIDRLDSSLRIKRGEKKKREEKKKGGLRP